ncbi:MAG: homoserine dehydrogenase [Terrimicrobiaceae bacterium]
MNRTIGIGLAGFGTVGAGVYKHLHQNAEVIALRSGVRFEVRAVAVRDPKKNRPIPLPDCPVFDNPMDLLDDDSIRVVVELMGGIDQPLAFVLEAIQRGKVVVTGNKALLAEHGPEIFSKAESAGVPVYYEAAVAGGIPIIKAVRESFVGNRIEGIHGILNGTSNYILTRMTDAGLDYPAALVEAQSLGYAEADPALDVNGWDAAHKAIILASLAYGFWVPSADVLVRGIDGVSSADVQYAGELGYRIKLLATIKGGTGKGIEVRVCPTLIPRDHVLASVNGVFNAVAVRGDVVGETLFYGRGAGQDPTSSSVLADLVTAAQALDNAPRCPGFTPHGLYGACLQQSEAVSQFYLRLAVEDRPGVLAAIAGVLGEAGIGISSMIQPEAHDGGFVPLILMIHDAKTGPMEEALHRISSLSCVGRPPVMLHVETFS